MQSHDTDTPCLRLHQSSRKWTELVPVWGKKQPCIARHRSCDRSLTQRVKGEMVTAIKRTVKTDGWRGNWSLYGGYGKRKIKIMLWLPFLLLFPSTGNSWTLSVYMFVQKNDENSGMCKAACPDRKTVLLESSTSISIPPPAKYAETSITLF